MKWIILLYGLGISGGANVIFEHAFYAYQKGIDVYFITKEKKGYEEAKWHAGTEYFKYLTFDELSEEDFFDVAIATEWRSAYDIGKINAGKYVYFVQSIESRFFENQEGLLPYIAENTYNIDFNYITEASWIKDYLKNMYHKDAVLVKNGMDKELFGLEGTSVEDKNDNKTRILVEGSVSNWLKNVPKTIELCSKAGACEIWLVTPDKLETYRGVDRLFSQVDYKDMPQIYRSCDLLVKLSLVEGMFGPPLEMFHCGGTAITYNINGSEEYLVNGVNSIVIEKNNDDEVITAISNLINDKRKLKKLQENAKITAYNWPDWNKSNEEFFEAVESFKEISEIPKLLLRDKAKKGANVYSFVENNLGVENHSKRIHKIITENKLNGKKLYIFGAGFFCKSAIFEFAKYGQAISGIVVTDTDNNPQCVLGHKVIGLSQIKDDLGQCYIYISSDKYYKEIESELLEKGIKYYS